MTPGPHLPDAATTVAVVDPTTDPRWDAYVERHPDALVYHHSGWLRSLRREYPRSRQLGLAALGPDGSYAGVLALQWTAGLPLGPRSIVGRRLSSLPRTPIAGPLADSPGATCALLARAVEEADAAHGAQLQVKLREAVDTAGLGAVAVHPWRQTFVIDLPPEEDALRFGNSRNHSRIRWAVNKAGKAGIAVAAASSVDEVREWYPLYLEALRFNAVPPRPLRLFLGLWEELAPSGAMTLLLARQGSGPVLAGAVILELGSTAFYAFNGVRRAALALRPNDVVQWEAIHRAVRSGRRHYDLGEVDASNEGLVQFKGKWGADARRLHRLYHPGPAHAPDPEATTPPSRFRRRAEEAYRRIPLPVTAAIGERLYRYL